mgnify:CR=1 FL=1|tara:strand:- start:1261 stop:2292 length:1032 start_codon:yes stop_codon:yes gene_type:complete
MFKSLSLLLLTIVIACLCYRNPEYFGLEHYVNYDTSTSIGDNIVWTYIEKPYSGTKHKTQFSNNYTDDIPYFLKICVLLMEKAARRDYKFVILTPENICNYIHDFPIKMGYTSQYTLKYRVDLLGAYILEKFGGIWLSPGTIIQKRCFYGNIFSELQRQDIVTFGSDSSIINNCALQYNPDNLVIASTNKSPIIALYKIILKRQQINYQLPPDTLERVNNVDIKDLIDTEKFNLAQNEQIGVYALGEAFRIAREQQMPFTHKPYSCLYDGRKDLSNRYITVKDLLGTNQIYFANKSALLFISVPYYDLYELREFQWFYNLSESQFYNAQVNLVKYIKDGIQAL